MYIFNRITVVPQLPKRIEKLSEIANNLWWSWNTEFLKLFKMIDLDLWESIDKNPTKFLKLVNPKIALIGVGENNNFGHPNETVLNRLNYIRNKNI